MIGKKDVGLTTGKELLGRVERTSKTRTFVPAKVSVSTSFNEIGERSIHYHNERSRKIKFNGKVYRVNRNIAG